MSPERTDSRLLEAALDVTSSLDLQRILENFVERACALTGARYAGLSVLDTWGDTTMSVEFGDAPAGNASPDQLPGELVERITDEGYVILNDPSLLENLPGFENFLGVSVTFQGQVYARLYLVNRMGGFGLSALRIVQTLASAAGIAVENAHLYADARRRARWIRASQQLTTSMLEGADEEEGLTLIAQTVREVSQADTAIIVLPSVKDTWAAEITDGHHADRLLGVMFPPEGRAMSVLNEGTGMIVDSLARAQTMRIPEFTEFGPALYAPLRGRGKPAGVLILLRLPGKPEFDYSELDLAESLAAQAALALELASAQKTSPHCWMSVTVSVGIFTISQFSSSLLRECSWTPLSKKSAKSSLRSAKSFTPLTSPWLPSTRPCARSARSSTTCVNQIPMWV